MPTLELTIEQIVNLIQQLPIEKKQVIFDILKKDLAVEDNPWLNMAGKYQDDPQFEEMLAFIEADRQQQDGSTDIMGKDVRICYILGARNAPLPLGK